MPVDDAVAPAPVREAPEARPESDFAAIMERPLFTPDRRPPDVTPPPQPEEDLSAEVAELTKVDVSATLILSPSDASVWLRDPASNELVRFRLGDEYEGWRIAEILSDRVLFERQGVRETLELHNFSQGKPVSGAPPSPGNDRRTRLPSRAPRQPGSLLDRRVNAPPQPPAEIEKARVPLPSMVPKPGAK
jgi:hypothetical protein